MKYPRIFILIILANEAVRILKNGAIDLLNLNCYITKPRCDFAGLLCQYCVF